MKYISIILAIFILGLSIRPAFNGLCCALPQENQEEISSHAHCSHHSTSENAENTSEDKNQDHDCTSFCSCACCNLPVVVQPYFAVAASIITHSEPPITFFPTFQYSFEYLPPIWQPPQIV
ncbi:MAG: DUF2946 family protein [Chitinophagales bacterium]